MQKQTEPTILNLIHLLHHPFRKNCKKKVVEIPSFRQHCKPNQQLCCSVNAYQSTPDIPDIQDIQVALMMTMLVKDEC